MVDIFIYHVVVDGQHRLYGVYRRRNEHMTSVCTRESHDMFFVSESFHVVGAYNVITA